MSQLTSFLTQSRVILQKKKKKKNLNWENALPDWPMGKPVYIFLIVIMSEGPVDHGCCHLLADDSGCYKETSWASHEEQAK